MLPAQETLWQRINVLASFGVITLLFAMIFKVLPDEEGGDDRPNPTSHLCVGAVGSLVIMLLSVYYSAQILFFGAIHGDGRRLESSARKAVRESLTVNT